MKKLHLLAAAAVLAFSLVGCGNGAANSTAGTADTNRAAEETNTAASQAEAESNTAASAAETESDTAASEQTEEASAEAETSESTQAETSDTAAEQAAGGNALVVYFSATGTTRAVAETLADMQGADLYEIVPEEPYTDEDLNYNDRSTRATMEQNDADARPAIAGTLGNLDDYDTIYVGYPIWWGDMPRILYTFFDTYDFAGKTIAPFCTSGGSGLSGTPGDIEQLEPEATVLDGVHVGGDTEGTLSDWLTEIGLNEA